MRPSLTPSEVEGQNRRSPGAPNLAPEPHCGCLSFADKTQRIRHLSVTVKVSGAPDRSRSNERMTSWPDARRHVPDGATRSQNAAARAGLAPAPQPRRVRKVRHASPPHAPPGVERATAFAQLRRSRPARARPHGRVAKPRPPRSVREKRPRAALSSASRRREASLGRPPKSLPRRHREKPLARAAPPSGRPRNLLSSRARHPRSTANAESCVTKMT
jgi:hypothetical protein